MVHRRVAAGLVAAALLALLIPAAAGAANRRISISNYRWSEPVVNVNLGEHVSWYWIGPDLMHSVTGTSPNAVAFDSDANTNEPHHQIGDTYQVTFDHPGTYQFVCKLHSTVRGQIVVSPTPGDPNTEPDAVPKSQVDLKPPSVRDLRLAKQSFRGGTRLHYSLNEAGSISADYYRLDKKGKRHFRGWSEAQGHVGFDSAPFAEKSKHFRHPRPGSYVAVIRATDDANNTAKAKRLRFTIR